MYIPTIEENYEYRMKNLMKKFIKDNELEHIHDSEKLQDELWNNYSKEFAHAEKQDMCNISGNEFVEI